MPNEGEGMTSQTMRKNHRYNDVGRPQKVHSGKKLQTFFTDTLRLTHRKI